MLSSGRKLSGVELHLKWFFFTLILHGSIFMGSHSVGEHHLKPELEGGRLEKAWTKLMVKGVSWLLPSPTTTYALQFLLQGGKVCCD
jgi:hypothetical protein